MRPAHTSHRINYLVAAMACAALVAELAGPHPNPYLTASLSALGAGFLVISIIYHHLHRTQDTHEK